QERHPGNQRNHYAVHVRSHPHHRSMPSSSQRCTFEFLHPLHVSTSTPRAWKQIWATKLPDDYLASPVIRSTESGRRSLQVVKANRLWWMVKLVKLIVNSKMGGMGAIFRS